MIHHATTNSHTAVHSLIHTEIASQILLNLLVRSNLSSLSRLVRLFHSSTVRSILISTSTVGRLITLTSGRRSPTMSAMNMISHSVIRQHRVRARLGLPLVIVLAGVDVLPADPAQQVVEARSQQ